MANEDVQVADIFSHRIPTRDISDVPFNIHCEDLIRRSKGKNFHIRFFRLRPKKETSKFLDLFDKINEFDCFSYQISQQYGRKWVFIANDWAIKIILNFQVDDEFDEEEDSFKDTNSAVISISMDIYSLSAEIIPILESIIEETGFEEVGELTVSSGVPVTFAFHGRNISYTTCSFDPISLDSIQQNYMAHVIVEVRELLKQAEDMTHGLVLINGPVGTGKSYLIRSIITEIKKRRAIVCTPSMAFLTEVGSLAQVITKFKRSMVILEDVGELVAVDAASTIMDARANLLNLTEGFLSLLTDAIIVISFNYDIGKIDPAIVRPGRCLASITVEELQYGHASALVDFKIPKRAYTLAEIYEMRKRGGIIEKPDKPKKMGFRQEEGE